MELTGFATFMDQLTMRNGLASPLVAQALLPTGQGRTMGLQTLIRKDMSDHFFGWVAYTIMRSERKNDDSSEWRLFDYDRDPRAVHGARVLAVQGLRAGWTLPCGQRLSTHQGGRNLLRRAAQPRATLLRRAQRHPDPGVHAARCAR